MDRGTPDLTRRGFLGACAAAGAIPFACPVAAAASADAPASGNGVLVDLSRCIGCRNCENACRVRWGRPGLAPTSAGYAPGEGRLSFTSRTFVDTREVKTASGTTRKVTVKRQCMHCVDPACVSVCPVAALKKSPSGAVVYDEDRCMGCRYCLFACPFGVPRYDWGSGLAPAVGKCDFCEERTGKGLKPACVAACPTGALRFGRREDLLHDARLRVGGPGGARHLLGDGEVGGTAWMYLSDAPAEELGFPADLPDHAMPTLTWKALQKVPVVIVVLGLFLAGVRRAVAKREAKPAAEASHG